MGKQVTSKQVSILI